MIEDLHSINQQLPSGYFWKGQIQHLMLLIVLVPGALRLSEPSLGDGSWLSLSDTQWVHLLIAVVIAHQVLVWIVFRLQICFSALTKIFGQASLIIWGAIFFPFLFARPLLIFAVGWSDYGSLDMLPSYAQIFIGLLLLIPALYTMWSIKRYFGFDRAIGGDHFFKRYREMPLVNKGAFRFSSNAMYSFGFLILWAIAFLCESRAALAMAAFQHAYIWIHMYCTEEPDLAILYRSSQS